jgi:hypothetical protein
VTSLRPDWTYERGARSIYGCSYTTIHTVAPIGHDVVATVVMQGPAVADSTAVYRPFGQAPFPTLQRPIPPIPLAGLFSAVDAALTTSDAR